MDRTYAKLQEFKRFQNGTVHDQEYYQSFGEAMKEIKGGRKTGHWSWYVFPTNKPSRAFQNKFTLSENEVIAYLNDRVLRERYIRFMTEVSKQLQNDETDPRTLLMSNVDVRKVLDSAELFSRYDKEVLHATKHLRTRLSAYLAQRQQVAQKPTSGMAAIFAQLQLKTPR